jgi:transcriptional regulator with XRE-family HTH domain
MAKLDDGQVARAFGLNLAAARKQAGLSQAALARSAGLSRDAVQKMEHGRRGPRVSSLIRLAGALGVKPATLLKGM